jgi:hypothetical protein
MATIDGLPGVTEELHEALDGLGFEQKHLTSESALALYGIR